MDQQLKDGFEQMEIKILNKVAITIQDSIKCAVRDIKEAMSELFNKDIGYINENIKRLDKQSTEHYSDNKKLTEDITKLRGSLEKKIAFEIKTVVEKIDNLDHRQLVDEVKTSTKEKVQVRYTDLTFKKVGLIIGVTTVIVSALAILIGYIGGKI